jgi:hypothetical protein
VGSAFIQGEASVIEETLSLEALEKLRGFAHQAGAAYFECIKVIESECKRLGLSGDDAEALGQEFQPWMNAQIFGLISTLSFLKDAPEQGAEGGAACVQLLSDDDKRRLDELEATYAPLTLEMIEVWEGACQRHEAAGNELPVAALQFVETLRAVRERIEGGGNVPLFPAPTMIM